jgi:hypothetical protein
MREAVADSHMCYGYRSPRKRMFDPLPLRLMLHDSRLLTSKPLLSGPTLHASFEKPVSSLPAWQD